MTAFYSGLAAGCLLGVVGTILFLLLTSAQPSRILFPKDGASLLRLSLGVISLCFVGGASFGLHLGKPTAMLLLFVTVLVIDRLGGVTSGLAASLVAALIFGYLFLPPIGSIMVQETEDRWILALFLLGLILVCRLRARLKRLA